MAATCKNCSESTTSGFPSFRPSTGRSCWARLIPGNGRNWCKSCAGEQKQRSSRAGRMAFAPFLAGRFDEIADSIRTNLDVVCGRSRTELPEGGDEETLVADVRSPP